MSEKTHTFGLKELDAPINLKNVLDFLVFIAFLITLYQDIFILQDLTEKTIILLIAATQISMFGLLADMIDKRLVE